MSKELWEVGTFNTQYFRGRLGANAGGTRYRHLIMALNHYHQIQGGGFAARVAALDAVRAAAATLLTGPRQKSQAKTAALQALQEQISSELKYLNRREGLGLKVTHDRRETKRRFKGGVGEGASAGMNILSNGNRGGDAKNYWLEYYDRKHRPGFFLSPLWERWRADPDACYAQSFWDWLETQAPIDAGPDGQDRKRKVRYLDASERQDYVLTPRGNVLTDCHGEKYDTRLEKTAVTGAGWAIYVMDDQDTIYAGSHITGRFHHSSFLAGKPVKAAGELVCDQGIVRAVNCKSGHYLPTHAQVRQFLTVLRDQGVLTPTAVVKPVFDKKDYYRAREWLAWREAPAFNANPPSLLRNKILAQIPASAQSPKLLEELSAIADENYVPDYPD